jgi:hypothetical protein
MMCSRRNPWRKTKAFCAPMATINTAVEENPWANTVHVCVMGRFFRQYDRYAS